MKEKKKLNIKKILIFILILYLIGSFFYYILKFPIKNIYIKGNIYLTDQEVIDKSGIRSYPSFILTTKSKIKKELLKDNLIESVDIKKSGVGTITITLKEYKPLFYDNNIKTTILSSGKSSNLNYNVPILTNTMPKTVYEKLVGALNLVETDVFLKLSEIEYASNERDNERFLIKTTDKIFIYVNIRKFEDINFYNELLSTLEGKTGIWHLDYGNFFVSD